MNEWLSFMELQPEVKPCAEESVTTYLKAYHYGEDNLREYFEAFHLTRYNDDCLEISDLIAYCEATERHGDWVTALSWAKEYSVNLIFNYETFEISWSDENVTLAEERQVYDLILKGETCSLAGYSTSVIDFYQTHATVFETILDDLKEELKGLILYSIYPSIQESLTNELFDYLEGGFGLFGVDGTLIGDTNGYFA